MRNPFLPRFTELPRVLPIFPLSGAVVMPGVQLPLNIFEPRYLNMVQAALASDHLIGMVQPKAEADIGGEPGSGSGSVSGAGSGTDEPALHGTGCAGRITSYSETNDGRIIMVLTGLCRFEVGEELPSQDGFRRIQPRWERFADDYRDDEVALPERERFMGSLRAFCDQRSVEVPWDDIQKMGDGDLVNLLCAHLPLGPDDKQALIETVEMGERAVLMRGLMEMSALASSATPEHRH